MQRRYGIVRICLLVIALFLFGAADVGYTQGEAPTVRPLRVGITPNYPPVIFLQNDTVAGIEADFANLLFVRLGRPLRWVELRWDEQIPALLEGSIDIIMSGMSVTEPRKMRIDFTEPYLKSGLGMMIRAGDERKYSSPDTVVKSNVSVGVVKGTTGEGFVARNFRRASQIVMVPKASDAVYELQARRIDVFVHDAPAIAWLVSENETRLSAVQGLLNEEFLAWGVRRGDEALRSEVNAILAGWKKDGRLESVLRKWLPYWKNLDTSR